MGMPQALFLEDEDIPIRRYDPAGVTRFLTLAHDAYNLDAGYTWEDDEDLEELLRSELEERSDYPEF